MLGLGGKKVGEFFVEIILSFPCGFLFGVVTPLDLVELYGTPPSQSDILVQNSNQSLSVGQIMVQVYREMVNVSCLGKMTPGVKDTPFLGSTWGVNEAENFFALEEIAKLLLRWRTTSKHKDT